MTEQRVVLRNSLDIDCGGGDEVPSDLLASVCQRRRLEFAADNVRLRLEFVQQKGVDRNVPRPNVEGAEWARCRMLREVEAGQDVVESVSNLRVRVS